MKAAKIYLRKGKYFISPLLGSGGGDPCLFSPPVLMLNSDVAPEQLGAAVQEALGASHLHAPWPTNWKDLIKPLLSAAGVKDWPTFVKGTLSVRADAQDGKVTLSPSTSKKEKNAFSPIDESLSVRADNEDAKALGEGVQLAISRSD